MKPSKKNWGKYLFFFVLTIAICYGLGLTRGAFPDKWRFIFGEQSSSIYLLVSNPKVLPLQLLYDFEKNSGVHVEYKTIDSYHLFQSEARVNDLLLTPFSWIPENPEHLQALPNAAEIEALLEQDFRSLRLKPQFFLPLFWTVKDTQTKDKTHSKELTVWGLYSLKEEKLHPEVGHLIHYLLTDPNHLAGWVLRAGVPSALESMNSRNDLSDELKPSHLRTFQLQDLKLNLDKD